MIHLKHKSSAISVSYPQINNSLTLKMLELYNDKDDEVMAVYYFLKVGTKKNRPKSGRLLIKYFGYRLFREEITKVFLSFNFRNIPNLFNLNF
jgi:hypothetical protein